MEALEWFKYWYVFCSEVNTGSGYDECYTEIGVNFSADVCIVNFAVDGKGAGFSAFVRQKLMNLVSYWR